MNGRLARLVTGVALAALATVALSTPAAGRPQPAPIDRAQAMSAADRAAIDAAAAQYLTNSIDKAPGLWLAVWDPKKGYYEQAYGEASLDGAPASTRTTSSSARSPRPSSPPPCSSRWRQAA